MRPAVLLPERPETVCFGCLLSGSWVASRVTEGGFGMRGVILAQPSLPGMDPGGGSEVSAG